MTPEDIKDKIFSEFNKSCNKSKMPLTYQEEVLLGRCCDYWVEEVKSQQLKNQEEIKKLKDSFEKLLLKWEVKCLEYPSNTPRDLYFEWCRKEWNEIQKPNKEMM